MCNVSQCHKSHVKFPEICSDATCILTSIISYTMTKRLAPKSSGSQKAPHKAKSTSKKPNKPRPNVILSDPDSDKENDEEEEEIDSEDDQPVEKGKRARKSLVQELKSAKKRRTMKGSVILFFSNPIKLITTCFRLCKIGLPSF